MDAEMISGAPHGPGACLSPHPNAETNDGIRAWSDNWSFGLPDNEDAHEHRMIFLLMLAEAALTGDFPD